MDPRRLHGLPDQTYSADPNLQPYVISSNLNVLGAQNLTQGQSGHLQAGMQNQQQQQSQMQYQPHAAVGASPFSVGGGGSPYPSAAGGMFPTPVYSDISLADQIRANQNNLNYAATLGGAVPSAPAIPQQTLQQQLQNSYSTSAHQNLNLASIFSGGINSNQLPSSNPYLPSHISGQQTQFQNQNQLLQSEQIQQQQDQQFYQNQQQQHNYEQFNQQQQQRKPKQKRQHQNPDSLQSLQNNSFQNQQAGGSFQEGGGSAFEPNPVSFPPHHQQERQQKHKAAPQASDTVDLIDGIEPLRSFLPSSNQQPQVQQTQPKQQLQTDTHDRGGSQQPPSVNEFAHLQKQLQIEEQKQQRKLEEQQRKTERQKKKKLEKQRKLQQQKEELKKQQELQQLKQQQLHSSQSLPPSQQQHRHPAVASAVLDVVEAAPASTAAPFDDMNTRRRFTEMAPDAEQQQRIPKKKSRPSLSKKTSSSSAGSSVLETELPLPSGPATTSVNQSFVPPSSALGAKKRVRPPIVAKAEGVLADLSPPRPAAPAKGEIRRTSGPLFQDVVDVSKTGMSPSQPPRMLQSAYSPLPQAPQPGDSRIGNDPSLIPESLLRRRREEGHEFGPVVERILMAAESRQAAVASASEGLFTGANAKSGGKGSVSGDGGQLMEHELKQLALLCASLSASSALAPSPKRTTVSVDGGSNLLGGEGGEELVAEDGMAGWAEVDGDSLSALTQMLEEHVSSASHIDMISGARHVLEHAHGENDGHPVITIDQWLMPTTRRASDPIPSGNKDAAFSGGFQRFCILRRGLDAAAILLSIMTNPGVDKRAVSDDGIESCISLMKQHLQKNVVPAIAHTGHETSESSRDASGPSKKKQKRASNQDVVRGLKKVYRPILATVGPLSIVMERMDQLIRSVQLDDQPLLTICASLLSTLSLEPVAPTQCGEATALAHLIHEASVGVISAVFRRYERHRTIILEDLFPLMLKLPTSRRTMRTYPIRPSIIDSEARRQSSASSSAVTSPKPLTAPQGRNHIQVITALILSLIQGSVIMPYASADSTNNCEQNGLLPRLNSGLKGCQTVCDFFTAQMIQRCSRKGEEGGASEFRPVLTNLVDDLLAVQLLPEYPAAEMLLLSLCRRLSHDLLRSSSSSANKNSTNTNVETTYLSTAMDTLGRICSSITGQLAMCRENPLKLPSATDQKDFDSAADPSNSRNEVNRCFCGRTSLVDTFMLDCDRCHAWFHGSCIGITKDSLPDVWICDECTLQVMVLEQTQAFVERCSNHKKRQKKGKKKKKKSSEENNEEVSDGNGAEVSESVPEVDETHIFRQLLLNYMTHQIETTKSQDIKFAREFYIAKWIQEFDSARGASQDNVNKKESNFDAGLMCVHFLEQWNPAGGTPSSNDGSADKAANKSSPQYLSEEGNSRLLLTLVATKSDLAGAFPRMLGVLVSLMGDDLVSLRKLAVKAIAQVINVDRTLMLHPSVRKAVSRRFRDEAISVREAAVSLVGSYVLQDPLVANAFHSSLLCRITDSGVSVRKRAVKIFRDILLSNPSYGGRTAACSAMLQRAADPKEDDGVRDLIQETFLTMWFDTEANGVLLRKSALTSSSKPDQTSEGGSISSTIVTPNATVGNAANAPDTVSPIPSAGNARSRRRKSDAAVVAEQRQIRCNAAAKQMIEVVASSGSVDFLTVMVKELLFGLGDGIKERKKAERKKKQAAAQSHCSNLVSSLVEQLLGFEESRKHADKGKEGQQLVAMISTLGVFAQASPLLIQNHLDTLLPYLKADNGVSRELESAIVSVVSKILSRVTPTLTASDVKRVTDGSVCSDLVSITYNFGGRTVNAAVEALAKLASHRDAGEESSEKLMGLVKAFYKYLYKARDTTDDFSTVKANIRNNVHRALSALGSVCRYHEGDKKGASDHVDPTALVVIGPSKLDWPNLSDACYAVFAAYIEKKDVGTKCKALRAMCGAFIARPRLMLAVEHTGVLSDVMSDKAHPDLIIESLRCWCDILLSEERRIESGEAKEAMEREESITTSVKISGDQDGDSTLVGGVLTQHSDRLYELTTNSSSAIRHVCVELIGHLLRQGLINPMETVPHLLALQGDVGAPSIRQLALKLLITEGHKRPDMLRQRVCAGVRQAFVFQQLVYPNSPVTAIIKQDTGDGHIEAECIFGLIFKESIRTSRVQRQGLFKSLLSLFGSDGIEDPSSIIDKKKGNPGQKKPTPAEQLPLLQFATQILGSLPYNSTHDPLFIIYNISGVTALQGAQLLDSFAAFTCADRYDSENHSEDDLERAAKAMNPSNTQFASVMNESFFDLHKFGELCIEASPLVLLLRLKGYLKKAFNLSQTRIMEYLPTHKEKPFDKGVSAAQGTPMFNSQLEALCPGGEFSKDAVIRLYAEFRKLMRTVESGSGMLEGDNDDKEDEHPVSKKRKMAHAEDSGSESDVSDNEE